MRIITVLDSKPLTDDGISLEFLKKYGEVTTYDQTFKDDVIKRCFDSEIVVINKVVFNRDVLEKLTKLKLICITATGYDNVDIKFAREKGISVTNIPSYSSDSVAQHTFALILSLYNRAEYHSEVVKDNVWSNSYVSFWKKPIHNLSGKKLGLLGYGNIGKKVAKIGLAFGMDVLVNRINSTPEEGVKYVDIEVLFKESDILSIHAPLTEKTKDIINLDRLKSMKSSAILINTARGSFVKEEDLSYALENGIIAGAGIDVMRQEPPEKNHPLYKLDNCIITPHLAWGSIESRETLVKILEKNIEGFLNSKKINIIN